MPRRYTYYFDISVKGGQIVLLPVKITALNTALEDVRDKMEKLNIKESGISEAIRWARMQKFGKVGQGLTRDP